MTLVQITRRFIDAKRVPRAEEPCFEFHLEEHEQIVGFTAVNLTQYAAADRKTDDWRAIAWVATRL